MAHPVRWNAARVLRAVAFWTACAAAWRAGALEGAEAPADPVYHGNRLSDWIAQSKAVASPAERSAAVGALAAALDDRDDQVRVRAADALCDLGPDAAPAVGKLMAQSDHPNPWVRAAAAEALVSIGRPAVPALAEAFEKGNPTVRARVLVVLGKLGAQAADALPVLRRAQATADDDLARRIAETIALIETPPSDTDSSTAPVAASRQTASAEMATAGGARAIATAVTADWPQFHGPRRDNRSTDTGLLAEWPDDGPPLVWRIDGLGRGYSSVAIVGNRLFTMGDCRLDGQDERQYVLAYDLNTRQRIWAVDIGPPHDGGGPRCTPTVDGQRLYALGTDGDLVCLETATGKTIWRKNLTKDFDGRMMSGWKYSESPLVDGPRLVCTPGGRQATMAALDKLSGETIWTCAMPEIGSRGRDGAGYSSAVVAEIEGVRQYVQMLGRGVIGVEAESGRFLWGYNAIANNVANITAPIVRGNEVFCTTSYRTGCALLRVARQGNDFRAEEVYFLGPDQFENHHGGVVLVGDHLYGGNGQNRGQPVCLDWSTGRIAWKPDAPERGSAAVTFADGHVVFRFDRGPVYWVEALPDEFRIRGVLKPPRGEGPAWPHPVVCGGRLYLRHADILLCYDLRSAR